MRRESFAPYAALSKREESVRLSFSTFWGAATERKWSRRVPLSSALRSAG